MLSEVSVAQKIFISAGALFPALSGGIFFYNSNFFEEPTEKTFLVYQDGSVLSESTIDDLIYTNEEKEKYSCNLPSTIKRNPSVENTCSLMKVSVDDGKGWMRLDDVKEKQEKVKNKTDLKDGDYYKLIIQHKPYPASVMQFNEIELINKKDKKKFLKIKPIVYFGEEKVASLVNRFLFSFKKKGEFDQKTTEQFETDETKQKYLFGFKKKDGTMSEIKTNVYKFSSSPKTIDNIKVSELTIADKLSDLNDTDLFLLSLKEEKSIPFKVKKIYFYEKATLKEIGELTWVSTFIGKEKSAIKDSKFFSSV